MHDSQAISALLHGEETGVWGDSAYWGQGKAIREVAPQAREFIQAKGARHRPLSEAQRARNRTQSTAWSKGGTSVSHYEAGLWLYSCPLSRTAQEHLWVQITCALVNLFLVRKRLLKSALVME